jgi:co-chaperonin GroES (HSP10)
LNLDIDAIEKAARDAEMAIAFPNIDPGIKPFGQRILVQIRTPRTVTKGGIITSYETREIDKWNQQIGIIRAVGPLAFCNRDTGIQWKEGAWAKVGDFVRALKWGADRWEAPIPGRPKDETAMFVICNDLDLIGMVDGDPLTITAINLNL